MNLFNIAVAYNSKGSGFFPGGKHLAFDVDPSPLTITGVKNEWNFVSTPCSIPSWSWAGTVNLFTFTENCLRDYGC